MRRSNIKGFTLIELMIVIAIIAIIAAIAIPGLLSSQRASNERNASASLKTVATAEADFRSNDRDGNKVNDFWTADVAGLYCMTSAAVAGNADPALKLIELSVASADTAPLAAAGDGDGQYAAIGTFATQSPKAGYWYSILQTDDSAVAPDNVYLVDTDGTATAMGAIHNSSRFGFLAYPDAFGSSGKMVFILNEGNTMFKRQPAASFKPSALSPPGAVTAAGFIGWPTDALLKADWGKMD